MISADVKVNIKQHRVTVSCILYIFIRSLFKTLKCINIV